MNAPKVPSTGISTAQRAINAAWPWVTGRRGLTVLATSVVAGGLAMNWDWLVAAGFAPILLGVLPCVAMCALGLCMNKAGGKSCSSGDKSNIKGGPEGGA